MGATECRATQERNFYQLSGLHCVGILSLSIFAIPTFDMVLLHDCYVPCFDVSTRVRLHDTSDPTDVRKINVAQLSGYGIR